MAVEISLGTTIGVTVGEPSSYDATGFGALSYDEIGEVTSISEYGGSGQVNTNIPLKTGIVDKRIGSYDYGTATLSITRDAGDAGQDALKEGFDGANKGKVHSFKVDLADGTTQYFTGVISSYTTNVGDANSFTQVSCSIELTNAVVEA